jgi:apolipoprotein N-acyltransferase
MVRSTASGQTCGIDPYGKILGMAKPFTESWITLEVPVFTAESNGETPYTKYGDYLARLCTLAAGIILLLGVVRGIIKKDNQGRKP